MPGQEARLVGTSAQPPWLSGGASDDRQQAAPLAPTRVVGGFHHSALPEAPAIGGGGGRQLGDRMAARARTRELGAAARRAAGRRRGSTCGTAASSSPLFFNDVYEVPLPPTHRFPMEKYRLVRERLQAELSGRADFEVSPLATAAELATTHCPDYVQRYIEGEFTPRENRDVGFPWSAASVERSLSSVGGTVAAARAVCSAGGPPVAGHIAGGTHHAFADRGEGFCVFSDIAVAANVILNECAPSAAKLLRPSNPLADADAVRGCGSWRWVQAPLVGSRACGGPGCPPREWQRCAVPRGGAGLHIFAQLQGEPVLGGGAERRGFLARCGGWGCRVHGGARGRAAHYFRGRQAAVGLLSGRLDVAITPIGQPPSHKPRGLLQPAFY